MVRDSQDPYDTLPVSRAVVRATRRAVVGVLVLHALWVILTHDWPVVAGLFVVLAVVYERRAAETLRRLRFRRQASVG